MAEPHAELCAERNVDSRAIIRAEFRAEKMAAMQKRVAEMKCRKRVEFGTERMCRKMAAMQMHLQIKCRKRIAIVRI